MKETKLYIFTTSVDPNPYINAIAHCSANYKQFNEFILIGITEDRGKIKAKENDLRKLEKIVVNQLDNLSKGKYLKVKNGGHEILDVDIGLADRETYSDLKKISHKVEVWVYQDLEQDTSNLLASSDSCTYIFDVTAVLKSYLVDIYVLLSSKDISAIHSFELFNKPFHDHRDLIHNLIDGKSYSYRCLTESLYTKDRMVINESPIIRENNINRLQSRLTVLESNCIHLEDTAASSFAKLWSLIYFFIWLLFAIWLCWTVKQPGTWDWIEPLLAIATLAWTLLSYLLQILFAGKVESLNPIGLFNVLKNWRKEILKNSRLNSRSRS